MPDNEFCYKNSLTYMKQALSLPCVYTMYSTENSQKFPENYYFNKKPPNVTLQDFTIIDGKGGLGATSFANKFFRHSLVFK